MSAIAVHWIGVSHLMQIHDADQRTERGLDTHQNTEGPRGQAGEGIHLQRVGKRCGENSNGQPRQQNRARSAGSCRDQQPDRNDDQGRNELPSATLCVP